MTNKPHFDIKEKGQCKRLGLEMFEQKLLLFTPDGPGDFLWLLVRKMSHFLG